MKKEVIEWLKDTKTMCNCYALDLEDMLCKDKDKNLCPYENGKHCFVIDLQKQLANVPCGWDIEELERIINDL